MIAIRHRLLPVSVLVLALAGCVAQAPPPPPAPPPQPSPAPPPPVSEDWRDIPLTPGDWSYRAIDGGSIAQFGTGGTPAVFAMRCDAAARRIVLSRAATAPAGPATLAFTTSAQSFALAGQPGAGLPPSLEATLAAGDRRLDMLAFSRGRFVVATQGEPRLVIPAWPEVGRVVEDCRG